MNDEFDKLPSLHMPELMDKIDYTMADTQYEIIMEEIRDFESTLDNEHEIAIQLCHFGQSILMNVDSIGYHNPHLIFYYGYVNGKYCQMIQHISQISFLLMSVPKAEANKPAKRIGFTSEHSDEDQN